jgi:uncharacterized membrane protein
MQSDTNNNNSRNVGEKEQWVSLIGGGLLAGLGIASRSWAGAGLTAAGGALIWRGATRRCAIKSSLKNALETNGPVRIDRTFAVPNKSPEEVYEFWRNLENLPRVIENLQSVTMLDERRSHWVAKGPAGVPIEWDAEITNDGGGRLIEWRSLPGSTLDISGIVRFKRKQGHGTKVHLSIQYVTPGGAAGEALANLLKQRPEEKVDGALQNVQEALAQS